MTGLPFLIIKTKSFVLTFVSILSNTRHLTARRFERLAYTDPEFPWPDVPSQDSGVQSGPDIPQ